MKSLIFVLFVLSIVACGSVPKAPVQASSPTVEVSPGVVPPASAPKESDVLKPTTPDSVVVQFNPGEMPEEFAGCPLPDQHGDFQVMACRFDHPDVVQCVWYIYYEGEAFGLFAKSNLKACQDGLEGWDVVQVLSAQEMLNELNGLGAQ